MPFINKFGGAAPSRVVPIGPGDLTTTMTLWTGGEGSAGEHGDGTTTDKSSPVQVGSLNTWVAFVSGPATGFATRSDGKLFTWGDGAGGQTGHSNTTDYSSPVQVGSLTDWASAELGVAAHRIASQRYGGHVIKTDGTLWGWGAQPSPYNIVGDGTATDRSSPVQIGSLTTWTHITGGIHIAGIADGKLYTWGIAGSGQLGTGSTTNTSAPAQVGSLTNWLAVMTGVNHTVALKTDGTIWSWGLGTLGGLGHGNTTSLSSPVQIGSGTNWASISAAYQATYAIDTDGRLWVTGTGASGVLGNGSTTNLSTLTQVGSLTTWKGIIANYDSLVGVTTLGTAWSWGDSLRGQLIQGDGTTDRSSPVQIGSLTTWTVTRNYGTGYRVGFRTPALMQQG